MSERVAGLPSDFKPGIQRSKNGFNRGRWPGELAKPEPVEPQPSGPHCWHCGQAIEEPPENAS